MSLSSRYRLLVFDWDGTLEDSVAPIVESISETLSLIGKVPPARSEIRKIIGLGLVEGLSVLYPFEDAQQMAQQCKSAIEGMPAGHSFANTHAPLFEGVYATLSDFKRDGIWLAVATGKSRAGLDNALHRHALADHFLSTRTADESLSKPNPDMLLSILDELGVMPSEALMIGDTTYDLHMANAASVDCVGVTYGVHCVATLQATGHALCLIDALEDLASLHPEAS